MLVPMAQMGSAKLKILNRKSMMNEKLKELLEEATEVYDDWKTGGSQRLVDHKMFAELILKECIAKIEQERFAYPDGNSDKEYDSGQSYYDCGYVDGMYRAETLIRELFGVKE